MVATKMDPQVLKYSPSDPCIEKDGSVCVRGNDSHPHFMYEKTEALRDEVPCPRSRGL